MKSKFQPKASGSITPRQKKVLQPTVSVPDYDYDARLGNKRILPALLHYIYDAIRRKRGRSRQVVDQELVVM